MSLVDTLMQTLGSGAISQISQKLGTNDDQARGVTGAAITALLGGLAKNAASGDGAASLLGALQRDHDGSVLDSVGDLMGGGKAAEGAGILKHVFGQKEAVVEKTIGQSFGIDQKGVGSLMTMLAPMVLGALGKQTRQQGMDASGLANMLGQEKAELTKREPQGMGLLGAVLDADGDGDVDLSDILKKGSGLLGKFMR